jgi:hypothetical protein
MPSATSQDYSRWRRRRAGPPDEGLAIDASLREILETGGHDVLAEAENGIRAEGQARGAPQGRQLDLVMPGRGGVAGTLRTSIA